MAEGFNEFMKNAYWQKFYNDAPSDKLKERIKVEFEISYCMEHGKDVTQLYEKLSDVSKVLNKEDVQYLYDEAQGGQEKNFYKKWLEKFDSI